MSASYPIIEVNPQWIADSEGMGTKEKFWYYDPDKNKWLFKHPRANTGEHWAEKLAAEVASAIGILHAKTDWLGGRRINIRIFSGRRAQNLQG